MTYFYALLADLTLLLHFTYVLFVVVGQILILVGWTKKWNWTEKISFRLIHFVCIGIVVIQGWLGVTCPLTLFAAHLREKAGEIGGGYETTFIGYWVGKALYFEAPVWIFTGCYTLFALIVVVTLFLYPPRRRSNRIAESYRAKDQYV